MESRVDEEALIAGVTPDSGQEKKVIAHSHSHGRSFSSLSGKLRGSSTFAYRNNEWFLSMGVLDIIKESVTVLRVHTSIMMAVTFILICPVTLLILFSHVAINGELARHFREVASLLPTPSSRAISYKLSETLLSYTFCLPVFLTLWPLAKAFVVYTVILAYGGKKASTTVNFSCVAPKLWRRLVVTNLWSSLIILGLTSLALLSLALIVLIFPSGLIPLAEFAIGVAYSVTFAHAMVTCNLASVVSVAEEHSGFSALIRSLNLIQGRTQVGLALFLLSGLGLALIEGLFQYRVTGGLGNRYAQYNATNWIWEGPLLVSMYSFLSMLDAIASSIFFFTCKASWAEQFDESSSPKHVSFGIESANIA